MMAQLDKTISVAGPGPQCYTANGMYTLMNLIRVARIFCMLVICIVRCHHLNGTPLDVDGQPE